MKLKLVAAISALAAIPALAHAQQGGPQPNIPKPTKADVQNVVQIISSDKAKTQAYCNLSKLYDQIEAAEQKNDSDTTQALTKQADALVANLGPEYPKMIEGLEQVDLTSGEGKEFLSILSGLDKLCSK
jgi:hypothetical protein